eukprot:scaffold429036_cov38-Prasinocladus_malaysianus.AAC.1
MVSATRTRKKIFESGKPKQSTYGRQRASFHPDSMSRLAEFASFCRCAEQARRSKNRKMT